MRLAIREAEKQTAEPGQRATCPQCDGDVIAKCGPILAWHWAHKVADCDTWSEPMTRWHADWQARYPAELCEVTVDGGGRRHRADVMGNGRVIEFQHSSISVEDINNRESFWGCMVWVFDARAPYSDDRLILYPGRPRVGKPNNPRYRSFRWKHPRQSIAYCDAPVYLDIGDGQLLQIKRNIDVFAPYRGWGLLVTYDEFVERTISRLGARMAVA
jgi:competence protein CoiA